MSFQPCVFDAFHTHHLPLPRPVGPYTVIRTTQLITANSPLIILGPIFDPSQNAWTNLCGYTVLDRAKNWDDAGNVYRYSFENMKNSSWKAAQVAPAAFSVQLMNPGALQKTEGIIYAGRVRTSFKATEQGGVSGNSSAQMLISYNMPRLLAAAKLAFRGTQTDAVPYNMARLAEFTRVEDYSPGQATLREGGADFSGFNPQFYYNPNSLELQFLVCCEWRVRFDPSNPAQGSHIQHPHADESIWMRALHVAEAAGNGVVDIADRVAETGNAIFGAAASAYRAGRGVRALTGGMRALALA